MFRQICCSLHGCFEGLTVTFFSFFPLQLEEIVCHNTTPPQFILMHAGESQTLRSEQKVTSHREDIHFYHTKKSWKENNRGLNENELFVTKNWCTTNRLVLGRKRQSHLAGALSKRLYVAGDEWEAQRLKLISFLLPFVNSVNRRLGADSGLNDVFFFLFRLPLLFYLALPRCYRLSSPLPKSERVMESGGLWNTGETQRRWGRAQTPINW